MGENVFCWIGEFGKDCIFVVVKLVDVFVFSGLIIVDFNVFCWVKVCVELKGLVGFFGLIRLGEVIKFDLIICEEFIGVLSVLRRFLVFSVRVFFIFLMGVCCILLIIVCKVVFSLVIYWC